MSLFWGSLRETSDAALPDETQVQAPVHEFPSGVMYCFVAPAARMPSMEAWLRLKTRVWSMSWYSLFVSKTTSALSLYCAATFFHHVLKPVVSVMMLP